MLMQIDKIRIDGGTQPRTSIDQQVVADYAEVYSAKGRFNTLPVVFWDGASNWLGDGFHRLHAALHAGLRELEVDQRVGTQRDAVLYSLGANASHGLRRSVEDKRKAVRTMLDDPAWRKWSNRQIAEACAVTHPFVASMRDSASRAADAASAQSGNVTTPPNRAAARQEKSATRPVESGTAPAESADDEAPSAEEVVHGLQSEIESLAQQVKSLEGADRGAEILKLHKLADHAQRQTDSAMAKAAASQERERWAMRQLQRCGKAVGETDPDRIAPKVEAMARASKKVPA